MKVQNLVVTEKYTKNGEEKKAYKTIGKLFTYDDGGQSIKLDMVPTGAWDGNANVYDIQPRQQQHAQPQWQQANYNTPQGYGQPNPNYAGQQAPQQQQYQPQNMQQQPQQQQGGQEEIPF